MGWDFGTGFTILVYRILALYYIVIPALIAVAIVAVHRRRTPESDLYPRYPWPVFRKAFFGSMIALYLLYRFRFFGLFF